MRIDHLTTFYKELKNDGVIFSFSGPLSQVILESIGETVRRKLRTEDTAFGVIQRVFSILVEQAQNVLCYSAEITATPDEQDPGLRAGVLAMGVEDGRYYVCCGNYARVERTKVLNRELTILRDLDPEALRRLYRQRRKSTSPAGVKGAGLGFIEMARRATRPIVFDIQPVNEKIAFFAIKAVI